MYQAFLPSLRRSRGRLQSGRESVSDGSRWTETRVSELHHETAETKSVKSCFGSCFVDQFQGLHSNESIKVPGLISYRLITWLYVWCLNNWRSKLRKFRNKIHSESEFECCRDIWTSLLIKNHWTANEKLAHLSSCDIASLNEYVKTTFSRMSIEGLVQGNMTAQVTLFCPF